MPSQQQQAKSVWGKPVPSVADVVSVDNTSEKVGVFGAVAPFTLPSAVKTTRTALARWLEDAANGFKELPAAEEALSDVLRKNVNESALGVQKKKGAEDTLSMAPWIDPATDSGQAVTVIPPWDPSAPLSPVFCVDGAGTQRFDDCLQVFWLTQPHSGPGTKDGGTPMRLCLRVHIVNAACRYPAGSLQDLTFRAVFSNTYFTTNADLNPILVPPCPSRASRDLRSDFKQLSDGSLFFSAAERRRTISADIFYDLDHTTGALVRDDSQSRFYHSEVQLHSNFYFDDEEVTKCVAMLESGILETLPATANALERTTALLKATADPAALEAILVRGGVRLPRAGDVLPSSLNATNVNETASSDPPPPSPSSASVASPAAQVTKRPLTFEVLVSIFIAGIAAKHLDFMRPLPVPASGSQSSISTPSTTSPALPRMHGDVRVNRRDQTVSVAVSQSNDAVSLIGEYSLFAGDLLARHPVLRRVVPLRVYKNSDLEKMAAAIEWAVSSDGDVGESTVARRLMDGLTAQSIVSLHTIALGVSPSRQEVQTRFQLAGSAFEGPKGLRSGVIGETFTHPGRDYLAMVRQRLLVMLIEEGDALRDSCAKEAGEGVERIASDVVHRCFLGHAASVQSLSPLKQAENILLELTKTIAFKDRVDDAVDAAGVRYALIHQPLSDPAASPQLPRLLTKVIVTDHSTTTRACTFATSDGEGTADVKLTLLRVRIPSFSSGPFGSPCVNVPLWWPTAEASAPNRPTPSRLPPIGTTLPAFVSFNHTSAGCKFVATPGFEGSGLSVEAIVALRAALAKS